MHSQSMQFVAGEWKESVVDSRVTKMCGVGFWGLFHFGLSTVRNVCWTWSFTLQLRAYPGPGGWYIIEQGRCLTQIIIKEGKGILLKCFWMLISVCVHYLCIKKKKIIFPICAGYCDLIDSSFSLIVFCVLKCDLKWKWWLTLITCRCYSSFKRLKWFEFTAEAVPTSSTRYTKEEKEKLKQYQALHGNDWKKISELMSRSNLSVAMKFSEIKSGM